MSDAAGGKDGVLAHDPARDSFEIIDDADLKAILENEPKGIDAIKAADITLEPLSSQADIEDEELSLVSTQALRRILDPDAGTEDGTAGDDVIKDAGFDPYNSG